MLLLAPSFFYFPSLLSRKVSEFDPVENSAEAFICFKNTQIVHGLASGEVEQDKGHDYLFVRPALGFHMKMGRDAISQIEDGGQVKVDGKSGKGGHAACRLLFFVLVGENALWHN